jgi:hypothetical protein
MGKFAQEREMARGSAIFWPSTNTSYRCPGCGEELDGTDYNAVQRHHLHILYPHLFLLPDPEANEDAGLSGAERANS